MYKKIVNILENNQKYLNISVGGGPQLGPKGLYHTLSGASSVEDSVHANLWVLAYSDGNHDLIDISKISEMDFDLLSNAASKLLQAGLIKAS
jgi:aminopeptidase-like protein